MLASNYIIIVVKSGHPWPAGTRGESRLLCVCVGGGGGGGSLMCVCVFMLGHIK